VASLGRQFGWLWAAYALGIRAVGDDDPGPAAPGRETADRLGGDLPTRPVGSPC
jgi:hypothetical protein